MKPRVSQVYECISSPLIYSGRKIKPSNGVDCQIFIHWIYPVNGQLNLKHDYAIIYKHNVTTGVFFDRSLMNDLSRYL